MAMSALPSPSKSAGTGLSPAMPNCAEVTPPSEERRMYQAPDLKTAASAFLDGYRAVADAHPEPWLHASEEQDIIDIFLLEKVAYEINYEMANRPAWLQVPLRGLDRLARRLLA